MRTGLQSQSPSLLNMGVDRPVELRRAEFAGLVFISNPDFCMRMPSRLVNGYREFVDKRLPLERSRYQRLAETGQRPEVMVICCCDSRVSPEVIFDAHPGELFVVRNVANLVPTYSPTGLTHGVSAALEFAVEILAVKHIIVMGHTHCGGIRAFVDHRGRPTPGDFIDNWMSLIAPAAETLGDVSDWSPSAYLSELERASIVRTLSNLTTFPAVRSRLETQQLELLGIYFDVASGDLTIYDPARRAFVPLMDTASSPVLS
jgi:carbonic anhydrase